ncbi:MAG TPA: hypothetical protein VNL14_09445 [Candidatus Acidoferrales bacterium]|nr:hypothetical protein [Candidatus Acidoferrales bacterium]
MKEEDLQIDLAAIGKEALRDRQPGEDLDEALLRVCKDLYGTKGLGVFQSVRKAVEAYANQRNLGLESALNEIASGSNASNVTTFTKSFTTTKVLNSLDELPPDIREQVQKALESGRSSQIVFSKTFTGSEALGSLLGMGLRLLLHSRREPVDLTPSSVPPPAIEQAAPAPPPVSTVASRPQTDTPVQPGMVRCENCRLEYSKDRASCPGCGAERRRSFWARLFGH